MSDPNLERDAMISRLQQAVSSDPPAKQKKAPAEPKKPSPPRISMDEIREILTRTARDEDAGSDRFKAIKMLASLESGTVVLPDPLTDEERIERIARIARSQGPEIMRLGYVRAFPNAKKAVNEPRSEPPPEAA